MFTEHTCTISRYVAQGTNGRKQLMTLSTGISCTFIPMSARVAKTNEYSVGFGWDIYFPAGTDVKMGDRLTWNGQNYSVGGSMPYSGFGSDIDHVHVIATTERPNGQ